MEYPIRYNVTPVTKEFNVNDLEEQFFEALHSKLTDVENSRIKLIRMSNGTLSVDYNGYPLGKIKLQGRKYTMQVIKSLYKVYSFEGTIDVFMGKIDDWIQYIHKYLK